MLRMSSRAASIHLEWRSVSKCMGCVGARICDPEVLEPIRRGPIALWAEAFVCGIGEHAVCHIRADAGGTLQHAHSKHQSVCWYPFLQLLKQLADSGVMQREGAQHPACSQRAWAASSFWHSMRVPPDCTRSSTITTCLPRGSPSFNRTIRFAPSRTLVQMTCAIGT